ncbi:MAG: hypothetical protein LBR90_00450 [Elusimicrobiota bacterium]|jgi:tetratricopeptide (TPR) repeat protein|nr:hypothetical protein [Elusimicrobiota bacterium]
MLNKVLLFLVLSLACCHAFAYDLPEEFLKKTDQSVEAIYNLDFDKANKHIEELLEQSPNHPIALFGRVMIAWSRFEYQYEKSDPAQTEIFEQTIKASAKGIREYLEKTGPSAQAYLALGGVYGAKARFDLANHNYVPAYFAARKGIKYMDRAHTLDPQMHDALLGQGLYQYYTGTLPAVIKVLATLVARGNAQKGIEYLNQVKDNGRFAAAAAKLILVEIYLQSDKYYNPPLAARYTAEVMQKYPTNPLFGFVAIIAQYENKEYDKALQAAGVFLSKVNKEKGYGDIYLARAYTAIASIQMAQDKFEEAVKTLEKSLEATAHQPMTRWKLWNILRLAQSHDALQERQEALKYYKQVIAEKPAWGIEDIAKPYLKNPFTPQTPVGYMSPP